MTAFSRVDTLAAVANDLWAAPRATRPIDAVVVVPGSKSITNRALVLAALADAPSVITRPLVARDTSLMADALRALGTRIEGVGDVLEDDSITDASLRVTPSRLHGPTTIDVGLAGTIMRFVPPVAALAEGAVTLHGDARAHERPLRPIVDGLAQLGVEVESNGGHLPITVRGRGHVGGGRVALDASLSSQFVSGLLLAGARFERGLVLEHQGPPVPSQPHVAMTVEMLRARGVQVDASTPNRWTVPTGSVGAIDTKIEPDLSNATPFMAAALVTHGHVVIPDIPRTSVQAVDEVIALFEAFGAAMSIDDVGLHVRSTGTITGNDVDLRNLSELTPTIAALAALADGPSRIRGVAHIRHHETDRISALVKLLDQLGAHVREHEDGLSIDPHPLHATVFETYDDHRLATAGAILGLAVSGIEVENIATTDKTFPGFVETWHAMLAGADAG
jgi:3-phosphoshikimate 1-carboxyvinyltransferase